MYLTQYSFAFEDRGSVYLVNSLNRAVLRLTAKDYAKIAQDNISALAKHTTKKLENNLFIFDDEFEEKALLDYFVTRAKYEPHGADPEVTFLTTWKCNFDCPYCYEKGVSPENDVDEEVMVKCIYWLKKFIDENGLDYPNISFYGGEPLMNLDGVIEYMEIARSEGLAARYSAVTNGYLLTQSCKNRLTDYNFLGAQITLDGPPDIHDKRRTLKNGGNTFERIYENILNSLSDLSIAISVNVDAQNKSRIPELLDIFVDDGLQDEITLAFNFTYEPMENTPHYNRYNLEASESGIWQMKLYHEAKKRGFAVETRVRSGVCRSRHLYSLTIDTDGSIYPCPATVGIEDFKISDVFAKTDDYYKGRSQFLSDYQSSKCKGCSVLPLCLGGCRHQAFVKLGNWKKTLCEKGSYLFGDIGISLYEAILAEKGGSHEAAFEKTYKMLSQWNPSPE